MFISDFIVNIFKLILEHTIAFALYYYYIIKIKNINNRISDNPFGFFDHMAAWVHPGPTVVVTPSSVVTVAPWGKLVVV